MVGNAKTKDQINAELADLIGDDFDPRFTDWLFNEVNQLSHGQSNGHRMQEDSMETETQPHSSPAESTRRSLKDVSSSARSAAAPYPQPSRVYDQINRALERPPVTVKHSIPDIPNVPTGPRLQSSAGPIRRGRGPGRVVAPPMPPDFTSFMLANGMPPEMLQQMMAESANFPNQMFPGFPPMNLAERISDIPMDGSSGIVVADGNRSRCRHWPRCQLGTRCKFHHPSQICPDFPKCPNLAGTCRNIHVGEDIPESDVHVLVPQLGNGRPVNGHRPSSANGNTKRQAQRPKKPQEQVPLCKFGSKCTKPECIFAHPTPAGGPDAIVLRGEMCPDGRACTNPEVYSFQALLISV
jgi:hypothetical protein